MEREYEKNFYVEKQQTLLREHSMMTMDLQK